MAAIAVHAALNTPGGDEKMAAEERRIKIDIRNQHPKSTSKIDIRNRHQRVARGDLRQSAAISERCNAGGWLVAEAATAVPLGALEGACPRTTRRRRSHRESDVSDDETDAELASSEVLWD